MPPDVSETCRAYPYSALQSQDPDGSAGAKAQVASGEDWLIVRVGRAHATGSQLSSRRHCG
jgi:hypothetical protein